MCMYYRGTEYHYGFYVNIQVNSQARKFNILMTKHMKNQPYVYSGLCLDNGLEVTTDKNARYDAVDDIIKKIVDSITSIEDMYTKQYPSLPVKPMSNLLEKYPEFKKEFTERMANSRSLEEYVEFKNNFKSLWEKPRFDPEENNTSYKTINDCNSETVVFTRDTLSDSDIYDCKDMALSLNRIKKDARYKNCEISYSRI